MNQYHFKKNNTKSFWALTKTGICMCISLIFSTSCSSHKHKSEFQASQLLASVRGVGRQVYNVAAGACTAAIQETATTKSGMVGGAIGGGLGAFSGKVCGGPLAMSATRCAFNFAWPASKTWIGSWARSLALGHATGAAYVCGTTYGPVLCGALGSVTGVGGVLLAKEGVRYGYHLYEQYQNGQNGQEGQEKAFIGSPVTYETRIVETPIDESDWVCLDRIPGPTNLEGAEGGVE